MPTFACPTESCELARYIFFYTTLGGCMFNVGDYSPMRGLHTNVQRYIWCFPARTLCISLLCVLRKTGTQFEDSSLLICPAHHAAWPGWNGSRGAGQIKGLRLPQVKYRGASVAPFAQATLKIYIKKQHTDARNQKK